YAFHVIGSVRDRGDLRHAHDLMQRRDGNAVGLAPDLEADNMQFPANCSPRTHARAPAAARAVRRPSLWVDESSSIPNRFMESNNPRDILDICSADAASSVEPEVVCCTNSRMRSMALTTACAPDACSSTAELISCVISFSRVVARAICEEPCDCSFVAAPISCANL